MASIDFSDGTVVTTAWLNDVNDRIYGISAFGAAGDGTTDDSAEIALAIAFSVANGCPIQFDGTKTYAIASPITFTSGCRILTNGCTFKATVTDGTSNTTLITVSDDVVIDELNLSLPTAVSWHRPILIDGDDIIIGKIVCTSVDQIANTDGDDAAVRVMTGARNHIGLIKTYKWDRGIIIAETLDTIIDKIIVDTYVRGLYLYDNFNLTLNSGYIHTASASSRGTPGAGVLAGQNGILLKSNSTDAQRNVTISNFYIKDAYEHAIRVGGEEQHSNIRILDCSVYDIGGCGLKVLGTDAGVPSSTNENIYLSNFIAEDVGTNIGSAYDSLSAQNRAGILLKFCSGVHVTNPIVRPRNDATSAGYGILIDGASNIVIDSPFITAAETAGIYFQASDGNITAVSVNGGIIRDCTSHGIDLYADNGITASRISLNGVNSESNTGKGFEVTKHASGTITNCLFNLRTYANTAGAGTCTDSSVKIQLTSTAAEISTTPLSGIVATNGSWVDDATTINYRIGSAWRAVSGTLTGSATYNPGSLADGDGVTTTVTVTGAALGDYAVASFSQDLQGITVTAWVSAADTVSVRFQNESGGVLDLASGTLRATVTEV